MGLGEPAYINGASWLGPHAWDEWEILDLEHGDADEQFSLRSRGFNPLAKTPTAALADLIQRERNDAAELTWGTVVSMAKTNGPMSVVTAQGFADAYAKKRRDAKAGPSPTPTPEGCPPSQEKDDE